MHLFERLLEVSSNEQSLDLFLSANMLIVHDFQSKHILEVDASKEKIENFITKRGTVLARLDYTRSYNKAFIVILFDLCERYGFQIVTRLQNVIERHDLIFGARLEAAKLYLLNVRHNSDLVDRFEAIIGKLEEAYQDEEEDDEQRILVTFLNYIAFANYNTSNRFVTQILDKVKFHRDSETNSILHSPIIDRLLKFDFGDNLLAHRLLSNLTEEFLQHARPTNVTKEGFLIEGESDYQAQLQNVNKDFQSLRQISVRRFQEIDDDTIFHSLGKGVAILENEEQLFSYMYSYGNMHFEKLTEAFKNLPDDIFNKRLVVVDWGCGQGLGVIALFDFLLSIQKQGSLEEAVLIEPSLIAIKRAALHARFYSSQIKLETVNKTFDGLNNKDFIRDQLVTKIHIFSNILDVQYFSLQNLLQHIDTNFPGENYFVCVSPLINDDRRNRLNSFRDFFKHKPAFARLGQDIDQGSGEWKRTWTRVSRVFKAKL